MRRNKDMEDGINILLGIIAIIIAIPIYIINIILQIKKENKEILEKNKIENMIKQNNDTLFCLENILNEDVPHKFDFDTYYESQISTIEYFSFKSVKHKTKDNYEKYLKLQKQFDEKVQIYNNKIMERKRKFESNDNNEVEKVLEEYLKNNIRKKIYDSEFFVKYNSENKTCIIEYKFHDISIIPITKKYTFIKSKNEMRETYFSNSERNNMYKEFVYKVTLKIIDLVKNFNKETIEDVIFNGTLVALNPSTGNNEKFKILSVIVPLQEFNNVNIQKIIPENCLNKFQLRTIKDFKNITNIVPFEEISLQNESNNLQISNNTIISQIDFEIDGFEFERFSKELLLANGFEDVETTSLTGDFGADVIAKKNDIKYAIQCKKYSKPVGVKAIKEVMGSKAVYNCHVAAVLTNNSFTPQARKLALSNNVLLWDREKLKEMIEIFEKTYKYKVM